MVCDTLVYHPSISRLVSLLDTSAGREKVLRLLQYLCRFLGFQYSSILAKKLQMEFTTVRKILRFLKPLNHLQAASKFYDNKIANDNVVRWCNVAKNLAYAGYLTLDQINLLRILQLVPVTKLTGVKVPRWTNWCWFAGLVSGLVLDLRKLQVSQDRIQALVTDDGQKESGALELAKHYEDRASALKRLLWDLLDTFIVLNNLKFVDSPDGSIGLAGVATSLFGLQGLWEGA
ncbi:LANO_0F00386g1_1 [Lachancea nothofagi CBS 11611]|uniref:LANO_0F00386g1_1 n=1 Tax=Lachancea nothofagi CBS 11611 TaxID=1266666 RepID=A0A1G4K5E0_9SACH|nr:LANO_0F00386g1_1 [Lachancea nothofagi CBS 11611]